MQTQQKVLYCFYKITLPRKKAKLLFRAVIKRQIDILNMVVTCVENLDELISLPVAKSTRRGFQHTSQPCLHTLMQTRPSANQSARRILITSCAHHLPTGGKFKLAAKLPRIAHFISFYCFHH